MDLDTARRHHSRYSKGDRDDLAREGHRVYERLQKRKRSRPDSGWTTPYVAAPVRQEVIDHLRALEESGVGVERIFATTGVAVSTLHSIRAGQTKRVTRRVADLVLGVHLGRIPPVRKRGEGSIRSDRLNPRCPTSPTRSTR